MRIGMILDNEFTGDPRVENEVIALQEAGFDVYVLCLNFSTKPLFEDFKGARIIRVNLSLFAKNKLKGLNNTIFNFYPIFWKKQILKFCRENEIEALHVHDLWMLQSAVRANKQLKLPLIADLHENFVYAIQHYKYATTFPGKYLISQKKWAQYENKYLAEVDKIIVVIEEAKRRLLSLGIPDDKIVVVANYVNIDEYSNEDSHLTQTLIQKYEKFITAVYTGGFDIHRGLEIVIKGAAIIRKKIPNFKLVLVGDGLISSDLKKLVLELGVEQNVDFTGYLPHHQLVSYVHMADFCLIPHLKTEHTDNTIPHKLFQYMLMKRPVIASNCDPIERIIEETGCGLTYHSGDYEEFAAKAIQLIEDGYQNYGESGYEAVKTKYNWNATSANLVKLYRTI